MYSAGTEHVSISSEQAFAEALYRLQHPADPALALNPLAHLELLAMGIGSRAWIEALGPVRKLLNRLMIE
jgi:hypothetical protein